MLIAVGGGGDPVAPPPPSPPPAPPPAAACTLHGDDIAQSAPSHHSSLFGSLWHAASDGVTSGATTAWHAAGSGVSGAWHAASPIVAPVEHVAHGAYDVLLKSDVEGVLQHPQTAKDLITTLMPGTGQALSTTIGAAQNYFDSKSPTHGGVLASLRASVAENNPGAAETRLAEHPKTTLATGFHLAMLGSWLIPGAGEAVDAGAHVAIAGGREVAEHVGAGAARDVIEHAGSKIVDASKLSEAEIAKTIEPAGRVFWSGGERALDAATAFAEKHGLQTIGKSDVGKAAERAEAALRPKLEARGLEPWTNGVRDFWVRASTDFAEHAEGTAHVFLRQNARLEESIWARVERPILEKSDKIAQIVKHDVF
jgi:hypothetical protein